MNPLAVLAMLTPGQRERVVTGFVDDLLTLFDFALTTEPWPTDLTTVNAVYESLARHELPPLPVLRNCIGATCFDLECKAANRSLTDAELIVHAAAWRLSDAIYFRQGVTRHRPRFVSSDD